jgi:hypothetical protein
VVKPVNCVHIFFALNAHHVLSLAQVLNVLLPAVILLAKAAIGMYAATLYRHNAWARVDLCAFVCA